MENDENLDNKNRAGDYQVWPARTVELPPISGYMHKFVDDFTGIEHCSCFDNDGKLLTKWQKAPGGKWYRVANVGEPMNMHVGPADC